MPADILHDLLDRERFAVWLAGHAPGEMVGVTGDCDACPLANYLRLGTGYGADVHLTSVELFRQSDLATFYAATLPPWAGAFVEAVDCYYDRGDYRPVPAALAATLLANIARKEDADARS